MCAAFVAERGHASRLIAGMNQVYELFSRTKAGFWESVVVSMSAHPIRAADTIKKRFAIDLFVGSRVSRGSGWPVVTAVVGACRAPYVLLIREDSAVSLGGQDELTKIIGRLRKDDKAVGVYLDAHGVDCTNGKCLVSKDYTGALVLDRSKIVELAPTFLTDEHSISVLIDKAGMHFLEHTR